jgi:hypothetical protein
VTAAYIGLPQPMVAGVLGREINAASGGALGQYGHELVNRSHPGGGWGIHHDAITNSWRRRRARPAWPVPAGMLPHRRTRWRRSKTSLFAKFV